MKQSIENIARKKITWFVLDELIWTTEQGVEVYWLNLATVIIVKQHEEKKGRKCLKGDF